MLLYTYIPQPPVAVQWVYEISVKFPSTGPKHCPAVLTQCGLMSKQACKGVTAATQTEQAFVLGFSVQEQPLASVTTQVSNKAQMIA